MFKKTILMAIAVAWATLIPLYVGATATSPHLQQPELEAGDQVRLSTAIEGKIVEVTETEVKLLVVGTRSTETAVPILNQLPHQKKLFKNVGTVDREIEVVLTLPKAQLKQIEKID